MHTHTLAHPHKRNAVYACRSRAHFTSHMSLLPTHATARYSPPILRPHLLPPRSPRMSRCLCELLYLSFTLYCPHRYTKLWRRAALLVGSRPGRGRPLLFMSSAIAPLQPPQCCCLLPLLCRVVSMPDVQSRLLALLVSTAPACQCSSLCSRTAPPNALLRPIHLLSAPTRAPIQRPNPFPHTHTLINRVFAVLVRPNSKATRLPCAGHCHRRKVGVTIGQ